MHFSTQSRSLEQRRLDVDLWILALVTFGAFSLYALFSGPMEAFVLDGARPLLPRLLPSVLVLLGAGKVEGYCPQDIRIAREVRSAGLPGSILGMALIAVVWGFFEGWNYAVICDKIDARYPAKPRFLSWGALVCAAVCLLFHPMEISLWGVLESLTTFAAIYGMLLVKRETGNAWGCVAAFLLIWNAL